MDITQRFLNYTQFDTQSSEESTTVPSTSKQLIFAKYLKDELEQEGLADVEMDEMGYIYATLKSNTRKPAPIVAAPTSNHASSGSTTGATSSSRKVSFRRQRNSPSCSATWAKTSS